MKDPDFDTKTANQQGFTLSDEQRSQLKDHPEFDPPSDND